jgi:hypothetical protein
MQILSSLFGSTEDSDPSTPATPTVRLHDASRALLYSLLAAAVWGVGAGAAHFGQALANVYRVPLVVLVSAVATLPAGILAWKALSVRASVVDLLAAHARGTLHGTLALAAFAPLLAIYSFTSGPKLVSALAVVTALAALAVAGFSFVRSLVNGAKAENRLKIIAVACVCLAIQLAALPQLISVMSPILPVSTSLAGGVEGLLGGVR